MLRIVTLGPAGTFSELATKKFIQQQSAICDVYFLPTIRKALHEIGQSCDIGIIPIENLKRIILKHYNKFSIVEGLFIS